MKDRESENRELIEFAAIAAGLRGAWRSTWRSGPASFVLFAHPSRYVVGRKEWNPLRSNSDAFELMVAIRAWRDHPSGIRCVELVEDHGGDENSAVRRAIVRAAAEIGKSMAA